VALGLALLVLPGPGILALVAGVALLAPHYAWARRILDPLHDHAVEAAQNGVATRSRIAASAAGALWIVGLGALWLVGPSIPEFSIAGLKVGPELPGGQAAGIGLLASGVAGILLLVYSVKRWYPGRELRSPE
jgi:hypothetical protein